MAFGLKQMKEGERTCTRCPKPKLSHKLDIMNLKCILHRAMIFSAEKFYSADIHYHNKVLWHVENIGNTLKKIVFDNVNYKDYCTNCIIHVHI